MTPAQNYEAARIQYHSLHIDLARSRSGVWEQINPGEDVVTLGLKNGDRLRLRTPNPACDEGPDQSHGKRERQADQQEDAKKQRRS